MRKNVFRAVTGLSLVIVLFLVLAACPSPTGGDPDTVVSDLSLDGKVIAPVRDTQPVTTAIDAAQYAGNRCLADRGRCAPWRRLCPIHGVQGRCYPDREKRLHL